MAEPDYVFKIIVVGMGGVGKTTLLHRYIDERFVFRSKMKMTIGVDIFKKALILEDSKICSLQLWDFGGEERFRFFQEGFVQGASGAFLLFDLTRVNSFNRLKEWLNIARSGDPKLPVLLLGTKLDLFHKIVINDKDADIFVENHNLVDYLKVSSKIGYNINEAFEILVYSILKYKDLA